MLVERRGAHDGVDEEDLGIYRPCILFSKQQWCEVSMQ
jgi:hypothetical protein